MRMPGIGGALEDSDVWASKSSWMDLSSLSSRFLVWPPSAMALYFAGGVMSVWLIRRWIAHRARGGSGRYDLSGKVVCVTGASGGLGKALCQILVDRGARVVMTGRSPSALNELAGELERRTQWNASPRKSMKSAGVVMDLANSESIPDKAREIVAAFGHVDVMIHNAGVSSRGRVLDTKPAVFFDVMQTNYFGPVLLTKELLPAMIERGGGSVVAVSSVQGRIAIPSRAPYAASKHALQAFFDSLRAEVQDRNIHILVTSPGYIRTPSSMNALGADGKAHGKMDDTHKGGMEPEYVAEEIVRAIERRELEVVINFAGGFLPVAPATEDYGTGGSISPVATGNIEALRAEQATGRR